MAVALDKVKTRIHIENYSFEEYVEYFRKFDNKELVIETQNSKQIVLIFSINNLPHLIGLHYAYDKDSNKNLFKGKNGVSKLLDSNFSLNNFKNNIIKNKPMVNNIKITWNDILNRIEWLPAFMNYITKKPRLRENKNTEKVKTVLNGDYFYFKNEDSQYIIMSLLKTHNGKYCPESFLINQGVKMLAVNNEIEVLDVYWRTFNSLTELSQTKK